jgi:hypothetical protein
VKLNFERVFGTIVALLLVAVLLFTVLDKAGCGNDDYVASDTALVAAKVRIAERDGLIKELRKQKAKDSLVIDSVSRENVLLGKKADRTVIAYAHTKTERIAVAADTMIPCQDRVDTLLAVINDADTVISILVEVKNRLLNELALERGARKILEAITDEQNLNVADYKNMILKLEQDLAKCNDKSWIEEHEFELGFASGIISIVGTYLALQ